jgi:hypothetical protein
MKEQIYVSTPVHYHAEPEFEASLAEAFRTSKKARELGIVRNVSFGDSLIERVRNTHISDFLERKDCKWFISLDADLVLFNNKEGDNLIDIMVGHDLEFVGGVYPIKKMPIRPASVAMDAGGHRKLFDPDAGLVEMRWLSTGCWCLRRDTVERMAEAYKELWYDGDGDVHGGKPLFGAYLINIIPIFANGKLFRKLPSEDWAFCHRWSQLGGKIWADPRIRLGHVGKFVYQMPTIRKTDEQAKSADHSDNANGREAVAAREADPVIAEAGRLHRARLAVGREAAPACADERPDAVPA